MKVLLTHRFFWPDTAPYASILRDIGDALAIDGHEVHVFSSLPSYRETTSSAPRREKLGSLNVHRMRVLRNEKLHPIRRLYNVGLYCLGLFMKVCRLRPDVVTASTFPPVLAGWTASVAAKLIGSRLVYHVQDVHPELSLYSGGQLGRGLSRRLLYWLDNQTLCRADAIVTLSEDMADTLRARGLGELPIHVINNPPLDAPSGAAPPPKELRKVTGKRRVIFAGNLGRFQNLPLLAEGVARCFPKNPELELMFLGEGVALQELRHKWANHPQVRFGPFLPFAQARDLIAEADVGLVSLSPNIYRVAYPSKIATYLDLGLKVLALVEPESRLAGELERNGHGLAPSAPTPEAIGDALKKVLEMPRCEESVFAGVTGSTELAKLISAIDMPINRQTNLL
jgi:colanic acid biosynthesis glycosyl transferase WcaI